MKTERKITSFFKQQVVFQSDNFKKSPDVTTEPTIEPTNQQVL